MNKEKLQVLYRKVAELIPYARNSRTHSDTQVAQIAASIKEFGFTNPVLIDEEHGIIAGHGRVKAAELLRLDEVPCIMLGHLTKTQRKAYVIADNRLALNAGWNSELLILELEELKEDDFKIDLLGFDDKEIGQLFGKEKKPKETAEEMKEWLIVVECGNENEQGRLYDQLIREGVQCKIM